MKFSVISPDRGSPPRVRGEVLTSSASRFAGRITPACAGRRQGRGTPCAPAPDHPRVCGEKRQRSEPRAAHLGSPPRVRGEVSACHGPRARFGDHPRVCGEKKSFVAFHLVSSGSPPRVRGEGCARRENRPDRRITPACAGRRMAHMRRSSPAQDHPRVCGEKRGRIRGYVLGRGSPPRVRGEGAGRALKAQSQRITPACAGRSADRAGERSGEIGSPPRVRGEVTIESSREVQFRITPACAGRRSAQASLSSKVGDHPRVCGEKELYRSSGPLGSGSPPRVRGEARLSTPPTKTCRITPACAGRRYSRQQCPANQKGSPPRVRGEGCLGNAVVPQQWITPACAGRRSRWMRTALYL